MGARPGRGRCGAAGAL
jgi:hypothetical protein